MTITTLFGINLVPLCLAIAEVESNGGTTSPNTYQLTSVYVDDFNRITGDRYGLDVLDAFRADWIAEFMMVRMWQHYGNVYARRGFRVTPEMLANIHRYGYEGSKQYVYSSIESPYWAKVRKHYKGFAAEAPSSATTTKGNYR